MAHTPGPWSFNGSDVIDSCNQVVAISGIAQPHGYVPKDDVSYANARLVSAVHDMLEALKALIEGKVREHLDAVHPSRLFCDHCGLNSEYHVHFPGCHVLMAEKAIAKAERK